MFEPYLLLMGIWPYIGLFLFSFLFKQHPCVLWLLWIRTPNCHMKRGIVIITCSHIQQSLNL